VKDGSTTAAPEILYDLFGTVNHVGNLQSGHYITNLKVQDQWFSINDQHVGIGKEADVLSNSGAYILFYTRQS
jgi:ubiquitin carboxyl-terminal hydrolase 22/27/51